MRLPCLAFCLLPVAGFAAPPKIVSDIPVTASLVQQVLGDLGEVEVLIGQGADPHHYQLRPSDARAVQSADMLVWIGAELTPWLDRVAGNMGVGQTLSLLHVEGVDLLTHEEDHDDHDHDHGETDAHVWLDPENAQLWLGVIADRLSALDPENAASYAANAQAARDRIAAMDHEIAASLAPLGEKPFVTFHDAYGYFTRHYGLDHAIAVSLGDASKPSAARMAAIRDEIAAEGVTCAFPEFGHDSALLDNAVEGSGVRIGAEIDPAGRNLPVGPALYEDLLRGLAAALQDCLAVTR